MKKTSFRLIYVAVALIVAAMFSACEGPPGLDGLNGADGKDGKDGVDANETCKQCHAPAIVDQIAVQYELSKHKYGEAAFEEAGNASCGPCHLSEAFKYVVDHNVPSTFTLGTSTYGNDYSSVPSAAYGEINCFTCHEKLHTTYGIADFKPVTTVAPVSMTMWGGAKTINLTADGGISNLCVKCHQPRPFQASNGQRPLVKYEDLVSSPNTIFFDGNLPGWTGNVNTIKPAYRTHTHYGTVGAIYAGVGGVEFGSGYTNSAHTNAASCQDCHMAPMTGKAGGHTFFAKGNFNGCNVSGCHDGQGGRSGNITSTTTSDYWKGTRDAVKAKLETLAGLLKRDTVIGGNPVTIGFMNKNGDSESNLWYGLTSGNYDGYLNVFDPVNNPNGSVYNTTMFKNPTTTGWTAAQIATNNTLPYIKLTNEQMGAIINFQLCLRDYSLGIHNTKYTNKLLDNTINALQTK